MLEHGLSFSVVLVTGSCGKLPGQSQDFIDFSRTEHPANTFGVYDRKRGVDQVSLFYLFTLYNNVFEEV